jgi:predicted enzyme related to lactoylglutathione lyase
MTRNIHALRLFIRVAPKGSTALDFYQTKIGLPLVHTVRDHFAEVFWAGEASMYEVVFINDKTPAPETKPEDAASMGIFRVHDLDTLRARLTNKAVKVTAPVLRDSGREAYFLDSDGYWVGLRERSHSATCPQDVEARRRQCRGEAFNPGCKAMPTGIQEIGWVQRRVSDLKAMTSFYRDVLELPQVGEEEGRVLLDLGDNVILELASGGKIYPAPADHFDCTSIIHLRAEDMAKLRAEIPAGGGMIIKDKVPIHWADLMYFTDPENGVVGVEKNYHPGDYAPGKFVLPECLEAERRWREFSALQKPLEGF